MKFPLKMFHPVEGSHMPVLINILQGSTGPVLELGAGFNSTPLLHWLCQGTKRRLVTYETSDAFYHMAKRYIADFHDVNQIKDWDELPVNEHWSVVFIDHAPGPRRVVEMKRFANNADYVVVHDSEAKSDWHYKFTEGFPSYKYRYDYIKGYPHTSVLSNFIDVSKLDI